MNDPIMARRLVEIRQQELQQAYEQTREAGWSLKRLLRPLTHLIHALTAGQPHIQPKKRRMTATYEMNGV